MTSQAPTQGPTDAGLTARVLSSEWQPIETAPNDGTIVDLWCSAPGAWVSTGPARVTDCWFYDGKWWRRDEQYGDDFNRSEVFNATHFMPLPTPPTNPKGAA